MGLNRYDPATGGFRQIRFDVPVRNYVNTVAAGSGGTLWLGTAGDVLRYRPADGRIRVYAHDPHDPESRSVPGTSVILEDSRGDVWMGAEWSGGGLDLLDQRRGTFRHLRHAPRQPDSLPDDYVLSLHEDAAGRIWVGTAKGLSRILREADGAIRFENGIGSEAIGQDKVFAIRSDAAGKLWVSTAAALVRVDPDSGRAERYASVDGLTDSFAPRAAHAAADGTLYFSGSKGITAVRPEQVRVVSAPARAVITDVRVFNRSLLDGGPPPDVGVDGPLTAPRAIQVPARDAVVSVGFAAVHYRQPEHNRLRYRLDGFDRHWLAAEPDQRSASYTNLAPGSYVFRVAAANDRGQWSEIEARLAVDVVPALWQTWWFRALMLAAFAASCGAVYALRVAHLERSRARLRELVAQRTGELERSNARLEALAVTDGLTGIANRRGFDAALDREWRRAQRSGEPVALALLDIDYFKRYNDHYGHQAGDECLAGVARAVKRCARRASDLAARYGGEEFALIAPGLAAPDALQRALDLCAEVARCGPPHAESPSGCVTVSVGVAVMTPRPGEAPEALVRRADAALYEAKRGGRNRAVLAGQE
jgi:diguanylate cyclase (GGDEF)-like protein